MGKCADCKHFKNFKYSYGCGKYGTILLKTDEEKDCFEFNSDILKDLLRKVRKDSNFP